MSGLLAGRRALVTGATRGIGAAAADALAEHGARVVRLGSRDADMADPDAVRAAVARATEELGGLDVLVNNAGTIERGPSAELALERWDRVLDVNLRGAFVAAQAAYEALADGGGAIVNIASLSARFGVRQGAAYAASKGGLVQLTRALALEWAPAGIRVNAVAPGYVATDFTRALQDDPGRHASILARIPMGRWATPQDIAGSVVYFASDLAAYVTGQVLYADGGYSCDG
jgi:2-deoxy-D-gluconate 3-dehydrogenase